MLNQVILVGRLRDDIKKEKLENLREVGRLDLVIPRNFKNKDGVIENDTIPCILEGMILTNATNYLHKSDIVGIKGRLQVKDGKIEVLAEKVTFLSSNK